MKRRNTFIEFTNSIEYLISILDDARYVTLNKLKDISKEELHWQFKKGWNTIGALLSHINSLQIHFRIRKLERREYTEKEKKRVIPGLLMGNYLPELITDDPLEYYIEELCKSNGLLKNEIEKLEMPEFKEKRKGFNEYYNLAWGLYHLAEDEIHHRGQITILRKLYQAK